MALGGRFFVLLFMLAPRFAQVYVDSLWFDSLDYAAVYWYSFRLKWGLFLSFFALTFLILRGAFWALERAFAGYELGGSVTRFDNQQSSWSRNVLSNPCSGACRSSGD
jgi:uncharacterized membrane protein (UPF0182 family)